jgi:hypothetical protein
MDFLVKVKNKMNKKGFEKAYKELLCLRKDLESFDKNTEFTQRTVMSMTDSEKNTFYNLLDKNLDSIEEITKIVKNSIEVIDKFIDRASLGKRKYGATLDRNDLSLEEWIDHAIEESMDNILYLQKIKKVIGGTKTKL